MGGWLADGMGGKHPENIFTRGDVIDELDCDYCVLRYERKDIRPATPENVPAHLQAIHGIKGMICRKCRGLGTWDQEGDICDFINHVKVGDYWGDESDAASVPLLAPESKWWNKDHEDIHDFGNLIAEFERKKKDISLEIPIGEKAVVILSEKGFYKLIEDYEITSQSTVSEIISAATKLVNDLEEKDQKKYKSVREKWGGKITEARKSSDFRFLNQFILGRTSQENYPFAKMENLDIWTEKNPPELEGLPEDFAIYLENFSESQNKEFLTLADIIPSSFRNDYFRILLCYYPAYIESSEFIPEMSEIDSVTDFLESVDVELIVSKIHKLSWNYKIQIKFLDKLFSQDLISKNTLYSTIANLSIGNLPHDRVISYLVRRRLFTADLTSDITDQNVRILTYLSLDPENFSQEISNEDFLILVNSLFFCLILSRDQLKTYIQSDMSGESEQIIRNFVDNVTNSSGIVAKSISSDFRNVLCLDPIENEKYLSLAHYSVIRWDKNNEMELCVVENNIRRKQNLDWEDYVNMDLDSSELKAHRELLKKINSQNPFWIARAIVEWDYSFTEEVRTKLDFMLSNFSF